MFRWINKFHDEVGAVQQNEDYGHCESVLSMGGGFHHHGQVLNHAEGLILINLEIGDDLIKLNNKLDTHGKTNKVA